MFRMAVIALALALAGCGSKSARSEDKASTVPTTGTAEKISVPGADNGDSTARAAAPGSAAVAGAPGAPKQVDDPKFHLKPDEGTLTIDKAEAKAGTEATAAIRVSPAAGYHISTEFPIKLTLEAPPDVKLAKTELVAGRGEKGDAEAFSEKTLAFAVKATADKAGAYEVKGMFKFGVCDKESCHPKRQPITIAVAAN